MAKTIKKHWDIVLIFGIGLFLVMVGIAGLDKGGITFYPSVQAATTVDVTVSATVAQSEELTVTLVGSGVSINGTSTTVTTTASTVPLGALVTSANTVAAHTLTMTTNAAGGYTVYTKYNNILRSTASTTKDINDFTATNSAPAVFSNPGTEAFGYTTEDYTLGTATTSRFQNGKWAAFETTDREVAYNGVAVSATTTKIGYQAGISVLTSAATDYGCTVTYTMTSTF